MYIYIYIYIAFIVCLDRGFYRKPGGGQKAEDSGSAEMLTRSVCKNDLCKSDSRVVFVPNRGGWRCSGRVGWGISVNDEPITLCLVASSSAFDAQWLLGNKAFLVGNGLDKWKDLFCCITWSSFYCSGSKSPPGRENESTSSASPWFPWFIFDPFSLERLSFWGFLAFRLKWQYQPFQSTVLRTLGYLLFVLL